MQNLATLISQVLRIASGFWDTPADTYNHRMANESAIIMPVAEVEPIVSPLRLQYDRSAALGVPAHITLLFPFYPAQKAEGQLEKLAEFFSGISSFEFSFVDVRCFPRAAYLHPDQTERFIEIINRLIQKWPDCKPYGGAFSDIVPSSDCGRSGRRWCLGYSSSSASQPPANRLLCR